MATAFRQLICDNGQFQPVLRSFGWLALAQVFDDERCEALLRRLSPADAEGMSGGWICIHVVTLGGIETGTLLEHPGMQDWASLCLGFPSAPVIRPILGPRFDGRGSPQVS